MAKHLDRSRYKLSILTLRNEREYNSRFGSLRTQYEDAGVQVNNIGLVAKNQGLSKDDPRRQLRRMGMMTRVLNSLVKIVKSEQIDLISAHTGPGFLSALLVNILSGTLYTITTYNVREEWHPLWLWRIVHWLTLSRASAIITDSQAVADDIRDHFVPNHRRIVVIPNGVSLAEASSTQREMRERFGIPAGSAVRVIGQISTLVPTKGQAVLLKAAPRILQAYPETYFLFIGFTRSDAPNYKEHLISLASTLGIAEHVRFIPYDGPISEAWQAIDIQAHPTYLDSLPQAIIEGMSLGKPCVASAFAGIPTMIDHGESGYLIEPGDSDALAEYLSILVLDPAKAERMGEAARRRYLERYTVEHMIKALETVYQAIITERGRRLP